MGRQSSYLTSVACTHCLRLPPPVEDAWNWQLQATPQSKTAPDP